MPSIFEGQDLTDALAGKAGPDDSKNVPQKQAMAQGQALAGGNADQFADALRLSDKMRLPVDTVQRNKDAILGGSVFQPDDIDSVLKDVPTAEKWMADPHNAALVSDNPGAIPSLYRYMTNTLPAGLQRGDDAVRRAELYAKGAFSPLDGRDQAELTILQQLADTDPGNYSGSAVKYAIGNVAEQIPGFLDNLKYQAFGMGIGGTIGAAGGAVAGTAATVASGGTLGETVPGFIAGGARIGAKFGRRTGEIDQQFIQNFGSLRGDLLQIKNEQGQGLDPDVVNGAALIGGALNTGLGVLHVDNLMESVPGATQVKAMLQRGQIKQALAMPGVQQIARQFGLAVARTGAIQGGIGGLQQAITIATQEIAKQADDHTFTPITFGDAADQVASAAGAAAVGGAGIGLLGQTAKLPIDVYRARNPSPEAVAAHVDAINQGVKADTTFQRSPDRFHQLASDIAGDDRFYVPADKLADTIQAMPAEAQERLFNAAPDLKTDMETALGGAGGDVSIKKADYAAFLSQQPEAAGLRDYMKLDPADESVGERKERADFIAQNPEITNDIIQQIKAAPPAVPEETYGAIQRIVTKAMQNAGRSTQEARAVAPLFARTLARFATPLGQNGVEAMNTGLLQFETRATDGTLHGQGSNIGVLLDDLDTVRSGKKLTGADDQMHAAVEQFGQRLDAAGITPDQARGMDHATLLDQLFPSRPQTGDPAGLFTPAPPAAAGAPGAPEQAGPADYSGMSVSKIQKLTGLPYKESSDLKAGGKPIKETQTFDRPDYNSPERQALRAGIVDKLYGDGAAQKNRVAEIVLGPPGSGKSSVAAADLKRQIGGLEVDADEAKPLLPEYAGGKGAAIVHEESADIAEDVMARAVANGDNIVIPKIGGNLAKMERLVDDLKAKGYTVNVTHVHVSPETSEARAIARAKETGRDVPLDYIRSIGDKPTKTYEALKQHAGVTHYAQYNNEGQTARLVESNRPELQPDTAGVGGSELGSPARQAERPAEPRAGPPEQRPAGRPDARPGRDQVAITPAGREIRVRYEVRDAAKLTASQHDDMRTNENYPSVLQPRDRTRFASQQQIAGIAENLNPRLLMDNPLTSEGAPIIADDGVVESGNGRVLAIRKAYNDGNADHYAQALQDAGYDTAGMKHPVLVRVRETEMNDAERVAFTQESNQRSTAAMSATEQAQTDSKRLSPDTLALSQGGDIKLARNRDFVRAAIQEVIPKNEQATVFTKDGELSQEAERRINAALLAKAYGDDAILRLLTESTDNELTSLGRTLTAVSPIWAKLRAAAADGTLSPDVDITGSLVDATKMILRSRREGKPLADYLQTEDMFAGSVAPMVEKLLSLLHQNKDMTRFRAYDKMVDGLTRYVTEAEKTQAGDNLFGEAPATPSEIIDAVYKRTVGNDAAGTGKLFQSGDARDGRDAAGDGGRGGEPGRQGTAAGGSGDTDGTLRARLAERLGQPGERGSITFDPTAAATDFAGRLQKVLISFTEHANFSTGVHEFAHWGVAAHRMFAALARDKIASGDTSFEVKRIADDWEALKRAVGAHDDTFTVEQEESAARQFEAYMREGHAPSEGLRRIFSRFRDWFTSIYRDAKDLNVNLSDEARGVFDRWLASEDEVAKVKGKNSALADIARNLGLSGDVIDRVADYANSALSNAEDKIFRQLNAEQKKRETQAYRDAFDRTRQTVAEQLGQQREHNLTAYMKENGLKLIEGPETDGIDPALVSNGDDAVHPDAVADLYGYDSGTSMLRALKKAGDFDRAVDAETRKRLLTQFPDMIQSGRIHNIATPAVLNDRALLSLDLLIRELGRAHGGKARASLKQFALVMAQSQVAKMKMSEVNYSFRYDVGRDKEMRQALIASRAGNPQEAMLHLQRAMVNQIIYKSLEDFKDVREKAEALFRTVNLSDKNLAGGRDIDFVGAARAVLQKFGLGTTDKPFNLQQWLDDIGERDPTTAQDLVMLSQIVRTPDTPSGDLTTAEYQDVHNAVANIMWIARQEKEFQVAGRKVKTDTAVAELGARLDPTNVKLMEGTQLTGKGKFRQKISTVKGAMRRVELWAKAVDGGYDGPARQYIWNPVNNAVDHYQAERQHWMESYRDILLQHDSMLRDRTKIETDMVKSDALGRSTRMVFRDQMEMVGFLLHTGNESNMDKLMRGYGMVDDSTYQAWRVKAEQAGTITKEHWQLVQKLWDLAEDLKPISQKAHRALYGYRFDEIEANPIQSLHGTFRGGYWPAIVDTDQASNGKQVEQILDNARQYMLATTNKGFTKGRVQGYAQPLKTDLRLGSQHIDRVLRFAHLEPALRDVARVLTRDDLKQRLNAIDPSIHGDMLLPWLSRTAQQSTTPNLSSTRAANMGGRLIMALKRNATLQTIAYNLPVAIQNFANLPAAAHLIGYGDFVRAMGQATINPVDTYKEMIGASQQMHARLAVNEAKVMQQINHIADRSGAFTAGRDFLGRHAMIFMHGVDTYLSGIVWTGAYNAHFAEHSDDVAAVSHADAVIREVMGANNPKDISAFEASHPMVKAFSPFYNFFNTQANLVGTEFGNIVRQYGWAGSPKLFMAYVALIGAPAVVGQAIVDGMRGRLPNQQQDSDGDPLLDWAAWMADSQVRYLTAFAPIIGQGFNLVLDKIEGKQGAGRLSASPIIQATEQSVRAVSELSNAATGGDVDDSRLIRDVMSSIGFASGVPLGQAAKPVGYVAGVAQGTQTPQRPADWGQGMIVGSNGHK